MSEQNAVVNDWSDIPGTAGMTPMFSIYERPLDFPRHFVVRRWFAGCGVTVPDVVPVLADTLEGARRAVPAALVRTERRDDDDPTIVEVWMELHVFEMAHGCDWVVAANAEDAWAVWCEHTGEKREDYEADGGFELVPDDKNMTIVDDPSAADAISTIKTCAEWAASNGRGFLSSTEY